MQQVTESKRLFISGVCCATEEVLLRKKLDARFGPRGYSFNQVTRELVLPRVTDVSSLNRELQAIGFGACSQEELPKAQTFRQRHANAFAITSAAVLAVAGIVLEETGGHTLVSHGLMLGAIVMGGWKIFLKAFHAVRAISLDMNVLMASAVIGALCIGKWAEGVSVILLFGLSLALESYSVTRTRRAIQGLISTAPMEAKVLREGKEMIVPSCDVVPGEILVVRPGERIGLDGVVLDGHSSVNQSVITGESTPVVKMPGSAVLAGSINERGSLRIRVTKVFEETMIARMIHLVEEAQQKRAPIQTFVERFARIYTPAVLVVAVLIALLPPILFGEQLEEWFYRALVLLVIACPCALVISTPVTIVSAITCAARWGVLIKGGRQIETLSKVKAVAFDKTGTLTEGRPRVTDVLSLDSITRERALQLVAAMEYRSEHHFATAILQEADSRSIVYDSVQVASFEAIPGMGIQAIIEGERYYLGNLLFCEEHGFSSPQVEETLEVLSREGKTGVVFGTDRKAIVIIAMQDTARQESKSAIARLERYGIKRMILLSGDHDAAASAVAGEVGLAECVGGLLPGQKVEIVEELKRTYGTVAMVGDGMNDAPALAASSVGIAMGANGTDVALETADVVLMGDDIGKLPLLIGLSAKAMTVVKQNIALAILLKSVFLVLSISGAATLWMAVLADDGAALAVILNGLRLLTYNEDP